MSEKGIGTGEPQRRRQPQAVRLKEPVTRREAIRVIGGGILAAIGLVALNSQQKQKPESLKQTQPVEKPENREDLRKSKLNTLLAINLRDPQRKALEKDYARWTNSLEEVELGIKSVVDPNSRIELIEKSYGLRSLDNPGHQPLSAEQVAWADSENIYPETLAMSKDARVIASRILKELIPERDISWFRPDIADKVKKEELDESFLEKLAKNPELMLLSAGGMARLAVTESGQGLPRPNRSSVSKALDKLRGVGHDWIQYGFANIGTQPAMEMTVNAAGQSKIRNDEAIEKLAKIISEYTGLGFIAQNIPGSERDANSSTGGALGLQIMPARALAIYDNLKNYTRPDDPLLHPLDPVGSMVMAYLYIAQGVANKEGFQYGYIKPPLKIRDQDISGKINYDSVRSWNSDARQIGQILASDNTYRQKFPN